MDQNVAEMAQSREISTPEQGSEKFTSAELARRLDEFAVLLDIDGTLLDLAPTPREVWVPPGLAQTLNRLLEKTSGALALVSGRSLNDIDLIFAPEQFPAVGGHGAEMRLSIDGEAVAPPAPPLGKGFEGRVGGLSQLRPGLFLGEKRHSPGPPFWVGPPWGEGGYLGLSL